MIEILFYENVVPSPWRRTTTDYLSPGDYVRFCTRTHPGVDLIGAVITTGPARHPSWKITTGEEIFEFQDIPMKICSKLDTELYDA